MPSAFEITEIENSKILEAHKVPETPVNVHELKVRYFCITI